MYEKEFYGIHDRFNEIQYVVDSQLKIGWTEEKSIAMDKLAQEENSYCPSSEGMRDRSKTGKSH